MTDTNERTELSELVRLDDPEFFLGDPHSVYARMRCEAPVMWCGDVNAFAITKYDDVRAVSRDAKLFSSASGIMLNDAKYQRNTGVEFYSAEGELITATDPPRLHELRRIIAPAFAPSRIAGMEPIIRDYARRLVARIEADEEVDFVDEIAVVLPIQTILVVLGLPGDIVAEVGRWSNDMVKMGAPVSAEELDEIVLTLAPLKDYLLGQMDAKRAAPTGGDDLISALLAAAAEGRGLSDENVLIMTMAVLVAGNETTRNLIASMAWALAEHPEQLARVRADRSLVAGAVDETLRWISPVIGHLRTATRDTELREQLIRAGQHLHLLYPAANRDEDVFASPDRYDVGRQGNATNIAFGQGPHVCPGASLARLEARVLFEEILARFGEWSVSAAPTRTPSILHNGFLGLPLTFVT